MKPEIAENCNHRTRMGRFGMSVLSPVLRGIVRGGVVVLDSPELLVEGTVVEVKPAPLEFTPEERQEFEAWDGLSSEAFKMIEDLERQERNASG